MATHMVYDIASSGVNPRRTTCYADEDMVGKVKTIVSKCHGSTAGRRSIDRYANLVGTIWWKRLAELRRLREPGQCVCRLCQVALVVGATDHAIVCVIACVKCAQTSCHVIVCVITCVKLRTNSWPRDFEIALPTGGCAETASRLVWYLTAGRL